MFIFRRSNHIFLQLFRKYSKKMQPKSFDLLYKSPSNCLLPVEKYISKRTGIKLYVCNIKGPVVDSFITLATEALDDDGLPHTLEHMIFLGSNEYPYSGILDILANKLYASGTNAWTDVDNTTYTLSTVEKNGFLQLLPIYLDHILYPLLNESGFVTEVYHVNGDGEDAGVVYSEMQSHENEDETIIDRAIHKQLYPNVDCPYRYETGGALKNLRNTTTHQRVLEYHKKFYKPDNMAIIIAGEIDSNEIIKVVEKFEEKILAKNPETWKISEKPFNCHIEPLINTVEETVYFPCDNQTNTNGILTIGWRGPSINNLTELVSLDLLFQYLTDTSISTLELYFVHRESLCGRIIYSIEEYKETCMKLSFINTPIENLEKIKPKFDQIINDLVDKKIEFNIGRMVNIIKMKISEFIDKTEDEPHDTISRICIGDFLYGEDNEQFKQKLLQNELLQNLQNENETYWLSLLDKWLNKNHSITVVAKPSEELMRTIGEEDKRRVEERRSQLGKKGLKELETKLNNSIEQNDDIEVPDEIYKRLIVPSLDHLRLRTIHQCETHNHKTTDLHVEFDQFNLNNLEHLQLQIDHLENTNFVQLALIIDTNKIDKNLRKYLPLYIKLMFELPVRNDEVNLNHEQVVHEVNKELLEFDASIGINGDEFDFGMYPQYLWFYIKVSIDQFEAGVKWLKYSLFDSVFDAYEIKVGVEKLLKEIKRRKQLPYDLLECVTNDVFFEKDCNLWLNGLLRQEIFLNGEIVPKIEATTTDFIISDLNKLKASLLKDDQMRFYMCTDLRKLRLSLENKKNCLDNIWLKYFSRALLNSNENFKIVQTWKMKKNDKDNQLLQDYVIGLGSTESSFLRAISSISVNSYTHIDYAGLLVLKEYFCQTEGPLWEAVRGPGYCYSQSINILPETAQLELCLDECSHVTRAYEATRKLFADHLRIDEFDEQLLESAKNSLIFLLIDDLKSVSGISEYSMTCIFKNLNTNSIKELFKNIQNVTIQDLKTLLSTYVMPLFDSSNSNCIVVCHPSKLDAISQDFSEKFDRKLVNLSKIDDSFCALW